MTLLFRTLLFTPATRSRSFESALQSGADVVCLDLEDSVPPTLKDGVRDAAVAFLKDAGETLPRRALRINHPGSRAGLEDLSAVVRAAPSSGVIVVPKVAEAAEIRLIDALLNEAGSGLVLAALVETLDGLENVHEIAQSVPRLKLLIFGAVDLSGELGAENKSEPMAYARGRIVHAGKRAGLDVMDVPELDFLNVARTEKAAGLARDLGFTGKAAIHPATLTAINSVFTPSVEQIAQAERIIAAFEASPNGLAVVDGRLIEEPVVRAMRRRLAIARIANGAASV